MSTTLTDKYKHWNLVYDFHKLFDLPRNRQLTWPSIELATLRVNLIIEETEELADAVKENNLSLIFDALCDIAYVVYGAGVTYGILLPDLNSNYYLRRTGLNSSLSTIRLIEAVSRVQVIAKEFKRSLTSTKQEKILSFPALSYLIESCSAISYYLGYNLVPFFEEVHRSNLTKIWLVAPSNNEDYVVAPCKQGYIVKTTTGKILKPCTFSEPNLEAVIESQNLSS